MPRKTDRPGKPQTRRPSVLLDEHEPDLGPRAQCLLFLDDHEYVRSKMAATNKTESEVIRTLVRKGIRAERLERAARDPVVNTLLKAVSEILGAQTAKLERRLSVETHTVRRLLASNLVFGTASLRLLEAYAAGQPPPDAATIAKRRRDYFAAFFQTQINEATGIIDGALDERYALLETMSERELITALQDLDLEAVNQEMKGQE